MAQQQRSSKRYPRMRRILWTLEDARDQQQRNYLTTRELIIRCGDLSHDGQNTRGALSYGTQRGIVERLERGIYALPEHEGQK